MRACRDLMKDDGSEAPAVDTFNIHENIVPVAGQVFENRSCDERTELSTITDKNGLSESPIVGTGELRGSGSCLILALENIGKPAVVRPSSPDRAASVAPGVWPTSMRFRKSHGRGRPSYSGISRAFLTESVRKAVWERQNTIPQRRFLLNFVTRRVMSLQVALCGINGPVNRGGHFSG